MELGEQISRQRVKYIVSSYHLEADDGAVIAQLDDLLANYPHPLIELALVETLVENWAMVPLPRGMAFMEQVWQKLLLWEQQPITTMVTPVQFQQISGLDPGPIFGSSGLPPLQRQVRPL